MSSDSETGRGEWSFTDIEPFRAGMVELAPLTRGMVLGGRYEIQRVIGRGGMGVVVRAHDRALGEDVAIKILRREFAGDSFWGDRLAREVKLARQIHHPNVCRVFDFQRAEGRVFLVMELASQRTLRSEIGSGAVKARAFEDRLADARAMAGGLGAIHDAGIVHRDVSAQNVLRMNDGRLVLSDFGLATDSCDNTTFIQGGTIAYLAPEVARGGRASFASDVWALGLVIHEAVFGERPHWRAGSFELLTPPIGRRLTPAEREVIDTCRACTAADPAKRPARAAAVAARLSSDRPSWRWRGSRGGGWALAAAGVTLTVFAAGVLAHLVGARAESSPAAPTAPIAPSVTIVPSGRASDWSAASRVLAEVDGGPHCLTVLPDRRTVRFVWGHPRRAEEVDTATGLRSPSPLLPVTYAEGCPDVSPDGRRILYPGHTVQGRAFAFVSERTDGGDAVPIVATAEPSQASEPTWLSDGQSFSYDIDNRHMGIYSLITNRSSVLPEPTTAPHVSANRYVSDGQIFVSAWLDASTTEISGFESPSLRERWRFHLSDLLVDWRPANDNVIYYTTTNYQAPSTVFALDLARKRASRVGFIPEQLIDRLAITRDGLVLVSARVRSRIVARWADGTETALSRDGLVFGGDRCGGDLLLAEKSGQGIGITRLDRRGTLLSRMTEGPADLQVSCAPDGRVWFYSSFAGPLGLWRCEQADCRRVVTEATWGSAVSPDGRRVAFVTVGARGPGIHWMASAGGDIHDVAETETILRPELVFAPDALDLATAWERDDLDRGGCRIRARDRQNRAGDDRLHRGAERS